MFRKRIDQSPLGLVLKKIMQLLNSNLYLAGNKTHVGQSAVRELYENESKSVTLRGKTITNSQNRF